MPTVYKDSRNSRTTPRTLLVTVFVVVLIATSFAVGFIAAIRTANMTPYKSRYTLSSADTNEIPEFDSELYAHVYGLIKDSYVDRTKIDDTELFYGALRGMVAAVGDPYTVFLDPVTHTEFNEELQGSFDGIGAEIGQKNDQLTIIAPLAGSPAEQAGLRAGDVILAVDDVETISMDIDAAIKLIRGEKGTSVTLTIYREDGNGRAYDVTIKRDTIVVPSVRYQVEDDIGIINLYNFNNESEKQMMDALVQATTDSVQALIIDLRNNPGGFLDKSVSIASAWLDPGTPVVREVFHDANLNQEYVAHKQVRAPQVPAVILVNEGSASASEIFAGALQDYQRATVVGAKTYGKGSVQDLRPLPDGSGLKITVAQWITPNGRVINHEGIIPDLEVIVTSEDYEAHRDPQLERAMEIVRAVKPRA